MGLMLNQVLVVSTQNAYNKHVNSWVNVLMVPEAGLEPARPKRARDFKSLVSTNSTTRAYFRVGEQSLALN